MPAAVNSECDRPRQLSSAIRHFVPSDPQRVILIVYICRNTILINYRSLRSLVGRKMSKQAMPNGLQC